MARLSREESVQPARLILPVGPLSKGDNLQARDQPEVAHIDSERRSSRVCRAVAPISRSLERNSNTALLLLAVNLASQQCFISSVWIDLDVIYIVHG